MLKKSPLCEKESLFLSWDQKVWLSHWKISLLRWMRAKHQYPGRAFQLAPGTETWDET